MTLSKMRQCLHPSRTNNHVKRVYSTVAEPCKHVRTHRQLPLDFLTLSQTSLPTIKGLCKVLGVMKAQQTLFRTHTYTGVGV